MLEFLCAVLLLLYLGLSISYPCAVVLHRLLFCSLLGYGILSGLRLVFPGREQLTHSVIHSPTTHRIIPFAFVLIFRGSFRPVGKSQKYRGKKEIARKIVERKWNEGKRRFYFRGYLEKCFRMLMMAWLYKLRSWNGAKTQLSCEDHRTTLS